MLFEIGQSPVLDSSLQISGQSQTILLLSYDLKAMAYVLSFDGLFAFMSVILSWHDYFYDVLYHVF